MIPYWKLAGRLGNNMFQFAFLYAYACDNDLDYYYQDEWYFKQHSKAIRTLFSSDIPGRTDAVAVHVRRGDYVSNSFYVDLTKTDYYERAMAMFPKDNFLIFSDDIKWCKEKFGMYTENIKYSEGKSDVEDMNLMASCKAHIIANSSFSWWASWLSPTYPDNKVIAPKDWYADGNNSRTILPNHWIRI